MHRWRLFQVMKVLGLARRTVHVIFEGSYTVVRSKIVVDTCWMNVIYLCCWCCCLFMILLIGVAFRKFQAVRYVREYCRISVESCESCMLNGRAIIELMVVLNVQH